MVSGIYHIKNNISGGVYYGRSVDVEDRLRHHRNELKRNVHRNKRLQNSWNKYGQEAFTFELIWAEEPEKLYELEGFILEFMWGDKRLYNHHKLSYGGFESGNKLGCFARSEETKKKMSEAFTGRVFSEEHRNNIRKAKLNKKASLETKQKMSAQRQRGNHPRAIKVATPDGIFECQNDAANFYNKSSAWIRKRCKDSRYPDFYLIV